MRCKSNFLPFKTSKTSFLTPPVYSVFQTYPPPPKKKATTTKKQTNKTKYKKQKQKTQQQFKIQQLPSDQYPFLMH